MAYLEYEQLLISKGSEFENKLVFPRKYTNTIFLAWFDF